MKTCRLCDTSKPTAEFGKCSRNKDALSTMCKACRKIYTEKYKSSVGRSQRAYQLRRYGLDEAGFAAILKLQDGVCAVCGGPPTVYDKYVVDHDHDTGAVRGLLCQHCNTGLGRFKDSTKLLQSASRYINSSRTNKFRELELKFRVPRLGSASEFIKWVSGVGASDYVRVVGQDVYWEGAGGHVIRHRLCGVDGGEITVKMRKSDTDTVDRVEVDLYLGLKTSPEDVSAFLALTGFKPVVALTKTSHIFTVQLQDCDITVVYYEVQDDMTGKEPAAFVEVEIAKEADVPVSTAKSILEAWKQRFIEQGLRPATMSLYELYSGKRYQVT